MTNTFNKFPFPIFVQSFWASSQTLPSYQVSAYRFTRPSTAPWFNFGHKSFVEAFTVCPNIISARRAKHKSCWRPHAQGGGASLSHSPFSIASRKLLAYAKYSKSKAADEICKNHPENERAVLFKLNQDYLYSARIIFMAAVGLAGCLPPGAISGTKVVKTCTRRR